MANGISSASTVDQDIVRRRNLRMAEIGMVPSIAPQYVSPLYRLFAAVGMEPTGTHPFVRFLMSQDPLEAVSGPVGGVAGALRAVGPVVRAARGSRPVVRPFVEVYHGATRPVAIRKIGERGFSGLHLGTLRAAEQRIANVAVGSREKGRHLYKAQVDESRIFAADVPIAERVVTQGLAGERREALFTYINTPRLLKELKEAGYTGIKYINDIEDPGSIAYVIWNNRAVRGFGRLR